MACWGGVWFQQLVPRNIWIVNPRMACADFIIILESCESYSWDSVIHEINAIDSSDSCLKGLLCFCVLWIVGFSIKCLDLPGQRLSQSEKNRRQTWRWEQSASEQSRLCLFTCSLEDRPKTAWANGNSRKMVHQPYWYLTVTLSMPTFPVFYGCWHLLYRQPFRTSNMHSSIHLCMQLHTLTPDSLNATIVSCRQLQEGKRSII